MKLFSCGDSKQITLRIDSNLFQRRLIHEAREGNVEGRVENGVGDGIVRVVRNHLVMSAKEKAEEDEEKVSIER